MTAATLRVAGDRSRIEVLARATLHSVRASGHAVSGTVTVDPGDPAATLRLEIEVAIAGIRSGDLLTDTKSQRHVESDRHPVARFVLDGCRAIGDGLELRGSIDWRGHRVPVLTVVRASFQDEEARGTASFDLDLRSFGLEAPKLLFLKVADVVRIDVEIVAAG